MKGAGRDDFDHEWSMTDDKWSMRQYDHNKKESISKLVDDGYVKGLTVQLEPKDGIVGGSWNSAISYGSFCRKARWRNLLRGKGRCI